MSTVNVSLPEELEAFVDTQVDTGSYESANQYLEALVGIRALSASAGPSFGCHDAFRHSKGNHMALAGRPGARA